MAIIDVDGDGVDEFYANTHGQAGNFFLDGNNEVTVWGSGWAADDHGVSIADFDADGDWDMAEATGGGLGTANYRVEFSDHLFVNDGSGNLENEAFERNVDNGSARARDTNWFDFNQDGLLDLFIGSVPAPDGSFPAAIFIQTESGNFVRPWENLISIPQSTHSVAYGDFDGDGSIDVVFNKGAEAGGIVINSWNGWRWIDSTNDILNGSTVQSGDDLVVADLNGDGQDDIYIARQTKLTDVVQVGANHWRAAISSDLADSSSDITFEVNSNWELSFEGDNNLSASDISVNGKILGTKVIDSSLLATGENATGNEAVTITVQDGQVRIQTDSVGRRFFNIEGVIELINADLPQDYVTSANDTLLLSNQQGQLEQATIPELDSYGTKSVGVGDFDNDGDQDIYLVRSSLAGDAPDLVLENDGTGNFTEQFGSTASSGIGQGVIVFDRNGDGALDVVVSDGAGNRFYNDQGSYRFFEGQADRQNHWLQLDLQDGIGLSPFGAIVEVNGQHRVFSSGSHGPNSDDTTLHYGLGTTGRASGQVTWADGTIDQFELPWTVDRNAVLHKSGDLVTGSARDDILLGNYNPDRLIGNAGRDILDGKHGADTMIGGAGNDVYFQNGRLDRIVEYQNGGWDLVYSNALLTYASANVEKTVLIDHAVEYRGSFSANFVVGNDGDNILNGFSGNDRLIANAGDDKLYGGFGDDFLRANSGDDFLYGGAGNDRLIGAHGADRLFGGAGADLFIFTNRFDSTNVFRDRAFIDQFDQIDLSAIGPSISEIEFELSNEGESGVLSFDLEGTSFTFELEVVWWGTTEFSSETVLDMIVV